MNVMFGVLLLVAVSHSAPQGGITSTTTAVPIIKHINHLNPDGSYTFGYESGDGSFRVEVQKDGVIKGKYGYMEGGQLRTVEYTAGNVTGFQPSGDHINVPPPREPGDVDDYDYEEERLKRKQARINNRQQFRQPLGNAGTQVVDQLITQFGDAPVQQRPLSTHQAGAQQAQLSPERIRQLAQQQQEEQAHRQQLIAQQEAARQRIIKQQQAAEQRINDQQQFQQAALPPFSGPAAQQQFQPSAVDFRSAAVPQQRPVLSNSAAFEQPEVQRPRVNVDPAQVEQFLGQLQSQLRG